MRTVTTLRTVALLTSAALLTALFLRAEDAGLPSGEFRIQLPLGISAEIWSYFVPRDNPMTAAKVELGRRLFFDKRLSVDGSVSCATCHNPKLAYTDARVRAEGVYGRRGVRNTPTLLNAMFQSGQFHDGRALSLEAQAKLPLINPLEMGNESHLQLVARLQSIPEYSANFLQVFHHPATIEALSKAIAAFERTLVSGNSPFDRFTAGDKDAMGEAAQRGFAVFRGRGRCSVCHAFNEAFPFFSDRTYRNTGVSGNSAVFEPLAIQARELVRRTSPAAGLQQLAQKEGASELGRFLVTGHSLDIGAFKIPSLRDVELTAPYFHDGSAKTLADVLHFYIQGGKSSFNRDWEVQGISLTEGEQSDLIEFLKSLTSDDTRRMSNYESRNLSVVSGP
ncbi:MAG TPA: cytochrome c peroxidase [Acidobacteriota bacterium]|jgi:cytochrome c peroxidase